MQRIDFDSLKKFLGYDYSFLKNNPHLGDNIGLLYIGGSRAYGLNTPESDYDLRGYALLRPVDYYRFEDFQQVADASADTVVYSIYKFINLLCGANPNILEVFDAPIFVGNHEVWDLINDNFYCFLSTSRVSATFKGYATQQKRRLDNAKDRDISEKKLAKYQCNCIRSLRMGAELLESGKVRTYRTNDLQELMDIKNGKYVHKDSFDRFFNQEYSKFMTAAAKSILPDERDDKTIDNIKIEIGELSLR